MKTKNYKKYKKAGCRKCFEGQIIQSGTAIDVTYFIRCECSKIKRKKYKKFLSNRIKRKMSAYDYQISENKWYDNNDYILEGNNEVDRSW